MDRGAEQLPYVGILLAAGNGRRFDPTGEKNKLLQRLPDERMVVSCAASSLRAAMPFVLAVIPATQTMRAARLSSLGCVVTPCPAGACGMAASLVHALRLTSMARGWIIALGDMPFVRPSTITALADALALGAAIAVPVHRGKRGNPVGFSRRHLAELLQLRGDVGARKLLDIHPVQELAVGDPGILIDIDRPSDLAAVDLGSLSFNRCPSSNRT